MFLKRKKKQISMRGFNLVMKKQEGPNKYACIKRVFIDKEKS